MTYTPPLTDYQRVQILIAALRDAMEELEHSLIEPNSIQSIRKTITHARAALAKVTA